MELHFPADSNTATRKAHRLPCTVHQDGELLTARAFCPFPDPIPSFRGRRLQAAEFELPPSSRMMFVQLDEKLNEEGEVPSKRVFKAKYDVDTKVYIYGHDHAPNPNGPLLQSFNWLAVSEALHKPLPLKKGREEANDPSTKRQEADSASM